MMDHIGEKYTGIVSSVMSFGMFVELPNLVEGMIRIDDLGDDYYIYQEQTFSLIGKRSKKRYMVGQKVDIIVDSVIKEKGLINFKLAKKGDKDGNKQQEGEV